MNVALVFAGGSGTRMNTKGTPKQFLQVNGAPIIIHTLEHFEHHPEIDAICIVCIEPWIKRMEKYLKRFEIDKVISIVPGGRDGAESIRNGLCSIREKCGDDDTIVLIHDGVRPLINEQVITDCLASVRQHGSAVTVVPATETIVSLTEDRKISHVVERAKCCIARAPQGFYLKDILSAHARALEDGIASQMVDSATLMIHYGHKLAVVEGPLENIKVTTPTDFYTCRAYLQKKEDSQIWGL